MNVNKIHLEPTNKCVLKCHKCSRTTFIEKFGPKKFGNHDLNLEDLKRFLDIDITGKQVRLCGDHGDPIYYPHLHKLVAWLKERGAPVLIVTNGSYQTQGWWDSLLEMMDEEDELMFSIDGTPEDYVQYRVNADWASTEIGVMATAKSPVKLTWKTIPFKYNQHEIQKIQDIAHGYGAQKFMIEMSDRWEENDPFKPTSPELLSNRSESIIEWKKSAATDRINQINPRCYSGNEHFVNSHGYYMPCCFVGDWNFYYKTMFYKQRDQFDIKTHTLSQIIESDIVKDFYENIHTNNTPACTFNCPKL